MARSGFGNRLSVPASSTEQAEAPQLYANFPRRLNGLSVDTIVLAAFAAIVITLASTLDTTGAIRPALGVLFWTVLLLYEPVLVWRRGGTVGHQVMNLRVLDNATGRRTRVGRGAGMVVNPTRLGG